MTEQTTGRHLFYTIILIAVGLLTPYLMLKLALHVAHLKNRNEKELHLKDLPRDKDDLAHAAHEERKKKTSIRQPRQSSLG